MNDVVPLIYTTLGNVPVDALDYEAVWEVTPDFIKLREIYKADGVVVKESAHVYMLKGAESLNQQAAFA